MSTRRRPASLLTPKERVSRLVTGALRNTINDHGPIDEALVGSATKRIVGQLIGAPDLLDEIQTAAVDHWRKKYEQLEHGHRRLLEQHERLRSNIGRSDSTTDAAPEGAPT